MYQYAVFDENPSVVGRSLENEVIRPKQIPGTAVCQQDGCEQMKNHVPRNTRQSCVFVRQLVDMMFGDNLCLGTIYGTCTTAVVHISRDNYGWATSTSPGNKVC